VPLHRQTSRHIYPAISSAGESEFNTAFRNAGESNKWNIIPDIHNDVYTQIPMTAKIVMDCATSLDVETLWAINNNLPGMGIDTAYCQTISKSIGRHFDEPSWGVSHDRIPIPTQQTWQRQRAALSHSERNTADIMRADVLRAGIGY